jgi:hypothetical protein
MVQRHDRWIAQSAFEIADILLGHACNLGEGLLSEALLPPQSREISAHQPAHVHAGKGGRLHTIGLSPIICIPLPRDYAVKHIREDVVATRRICIALVAILLWSDLSPIILRCV